MTVAHAEQTAIRNGHPGWTPAVRRAMNNALTVRGALAGLTNGHIAVINDALIGSPVRVRSLHVHGKHRTAIGIFAGIKDTWCFGASQVSVTFAGVFTGTESEGTVGYDESVRDFLARPVIRTSNIGRVIGIGAVQSFEVIGPQRTRCSQCGGWAHSGALFDLGPHRSTPEPGETSVNSHLVCRKMDSMGDCA